MDLGDGSTISSPLDALLYLITSIDESDNWIFGVALDPDKLPTADPNTATTVTHTYASAGTYTANIDSCCRISASAAPNEHINNPGDGYETRNVVDVGSQDSSATSSLPPFVSCAINAVCSFFVPGSDPDGDPLNFRMSTASEAGDPGFDQPGPPDATNAASINASTGQYTWDTNGATLAANSSNNTLYSTHVTIESLDGSSNVKGSVALDFMIKLIVGSGESPVFDIPPTPDDAGGSDCAGTHSVSPGGTVGYTVQASDADSGDTVTLNATGVPPGATHSPTLSTTGNPVSTTFSWTPTAAQVGTHVVSYTATDDASQQTLCSQTISVSTDVTATETPSLGEAVVWTLVISRTEAPNLQEEVVVGFPRTDTLSLGEAVATALGFSRTDTPSLGAAVATALGFSRTDTPSLGAAVATALGFSRTEVPNLQEEVELGFPRTDTPGLGEAVAWTLVISRAEASNLQEEVVLGFPRTETLSLGEAVATALGFSRTEAPNLHEEVVLGFPRTDTPSLSEAVAVSLELSGTDTSSLGETVASALGLPRMDTASLGEAIISALVLSRTDTASLGESVATTLGLPRTDTASLREAIISALVLSRTDTASLGEAVISVLALSRTDTASLGESVATTLGLPRTDTASLGEGIISALALSRTDTASFGESVATTLGLSRTDTTSLGESVATTLGLPRTDTASLEEAIISDLVLSRTDTSSLGASVATTLGIPRTDTASLGEAIISDLVLSRTDTSSLGESVATTLGLPRTDTASLEEVIISALVLSRTDTSSLGEAAATSVGLLRTDTASVGGSVQSITSKEVTDIAVLGVAVAFSIHHSSTDLDVTKAGSPDPVLAGSDLTYTLRVTNKGPSTPTGVTLTDTLPADVSFVSASPSCVRTGGTVICGLGTLSSGGSSAVTIVVAPNSTGDITNTASVTGNELDPNTDDNTASETSTVNPAANLGLAKGGSPDPVLLGSDLTYTLTVTNKGPSTGTGVSLIDTLPAGVSFVSSVPSQGNCSGTSTVTCGLGTLSSGDSATVTIVVTPNSTGDITNTASVTGNEGDPGIGDNTASEVNTVNMAADLSVTKTDSSDPVLVGSNLTYTVTVTNKGPSTANEVTLTDTLPGTVTLTLATPSQGNCIGTNIITCDLGTLVSGDNATVTIIVTTNSTGNITNTASMTSGLSDPQVSDNSASQSTIVTVPSVAGLSVIKSDTPDPVFVGNALVYTVTVANSGPQQATGVVLTDILPANVTFSSALATQGSCSQESGTVICNLGDISNLSSADATITVTPTAAAGDTTITNSASVTSGVGDPSTGDNTDSQSTVVLPLADLSVTKADSPDPAPAGGLLTYDLVVTNRGPSRATDVVLTDALPANVTYGLAVANHGSCNQALGIVTCDVGHINSGDNVTVTITVIPTAAAADSTITNTASVTSGVTDPNTGDNTTSHETGIIPSSDLSVTIDDPPNGVITGKQLTYTVTVTNKGPSTAEGVTLADTLPASGDFVSSTPSQGTCSGTSTVTCNLGTLASGDISTVTIVVTVQVNISTGGLKTITNTVTVTGDEFDPDTSSNIGDVTTNIYLDDDGDGIGEQVEDGAPNTGDGNNDGLLDKDQDNVVSLLNAVDAQYATIVSTGDSHLKNVEAIENPSTGDLPEGEEFPAGFFGFEVENVQPAVSNTIDLLFPEGTIILSYWKYGPTGDGLAPHWYKFEFDGTTGAFIDNNKVTLHFVDGQRGDDDLIANGVIVDAGGPVFAPADLSLIHTDSPDPVLVGATLTYT